MKRRPGHASVEEHPKPERIVIGCPLCGSNHRIQTFGRGIELFACPKASRDELSFATELLRIEELT